MYPQQGIIDDAGLRPLTRTLYRVLIDHGAFEGEHVELLRGVLVPMSPQGPRHSHPIVELTERLVLALHGRAKVRVQLPFAADDESEPEPDLAVVPVGSFDDDHPDRAFLLVEVGVSSLKLDRGAKATLYAGSRVAEYWIVDVPAATVTVYADAHDGAWRTMTTHGREHALSVPGFQDVVIALADILRPPRAC